MFHEKVTDWLVCNTQLSSKVSVCHLSQQLDDRITLISMILEDGYVLCDASSYEQHKDQINFNSFFTMVARQYSG